MELKSAKQSREHFDKSNCLITFYNCTPNKVTPYWIDFHGRPVAYSTLEKGDYYDMNTFINHLWIFKEETENSDEDEVQSDETVNSILNNYYKIVAIPEESIKLNQSNISLSQNIPNQDESVLLCQLCNFLVQNNCLNPNPGTCPHLDGEAKVLFSDIVDSKYTSNYYPSYVYSCNDDTHCEAHNTSRRNIYLVRSIHNLRDLCFFKLNNIAKTNSTLKTTNIPLSLQEEYEQHVKFLKTNVKHRNLLQQNQ